MRRPFLFSLTVLLLLGFTQSVSADNLVKMNGSYRLAAGVGNDFILNDSNSDLQERNFRYVFGERLNNTFDPAVYDKFLLNVDFSPADPVNFYTQFVADPWSWVGTTGEQIQKSDIGTEEIRYNLKYFGANNSVLNEIWRTNVSDSFAFPVIKVHDGHTTKTIVHGFNDFSPATGGVPITIPDLNIDYEFRPIRKLWMDAHGGAVKLRVFALADETQALTTDDPLELSNHKDYWQQSPWLYQYVPAQFFTDHSLKRGYYSDSLSFLAKDSEGNRLVLLKGLTLQGEWDKTNLISTVAAPFTPWDEKYFGADNIEGATRIKYDVNPKLVLGATHTFRTGMVDMAVADVNQVFAGDTEYQVSRDTTFKGEVAGSYRKSDLLTNDEIKTDSDSTAYRGVVDKKFTHQKLWQGESDIHLSYTQMNEKFEPLLSRYTNTRDDHFWGNHLTFTEYSPDMEHFRVGDGVDINRTTVRARWREKFFKQRFENLFDVRNVHKASNSAYKETVLRNETTHHINSKLTAKTLFRWHGLPHATKNKEPFLSNFYFYGPNVGNFADPLGDLQNVAVTEEKDPSRFTYAAALQYVHDKQWTAEGFFERTNDLPDFPRGLLNGTFRDSNDRVDGILTDHLTNFLYSQGPLGGAPPYEYFTVFRERLIYKPDDKVTLTFHAAQNSYKFATGIDDNINHQGLSVAFNLDNRTTFFADYTHSLQIDLPKLVATSLSQSDYRDHHNVYLSMDYKLSASQVFRAEYGVFGMGTATPLVTPYSVTSFSLPTIDTEHLLRVSLTGDF